MTQTVPDISPLMPMHQDPLLVTVRIYTNVKFEILVSISVENIVVQPNGLLYISSYIKWSWENRLHGPDAMFVPYLWAGCLCLAEKLAEAVM